MTYFYKLVLGKLKSEMFINYRKLYIYETNGDLPYDRIFSKDPYYIGVWEEDGLYLLFFLEDRSQFVERVLSSFCVELCGKYVMDYEDWQVIEDERLVFGDIEITPFWRKDGEGTKIFIDPSVVFGSGYHPTTKGCLEAIWKIYKIDSPRIILDLGTGTGILSLFCVKLGAKFCTAVDKNGLCVECVKRNVALNRMEGYIDVKKGDVRNFLDVERDLCVANLPYIVLESLIEDERFFKEKYLIMSGFMDEGARRIISKLRSKGFSRIDRRSYQKWEVLTVFLLD